ncbi:restriction endonuclease [Burkholderia sp. Ac-20365]|uniref:restriction endonuclease n=1 Tax=Burkholderia sp. Ac-20365 TaxID=2703897 RepID=UPI00197B13B0|nr:restriction endonuclease [Burkholderia sp. Ac-20365]MBN3761179.1 restriction endonuclease [Burkholderia sp. Ac-20365]
MTRPTRTINKLHFEDLSAGRFEDLSLALVYRLRQWQDIHHDGRTGADGGVDIRAIEAALDNSLRDWYVQCKRYATFAAADAKAAVHEAVGKATVPPDVMLLIVGCDVSLATRTAYEKAAADAGIQTAILWTASKLEAMLYAEHPDLLFSYFGVSLARQERKREDDLRRRLAMKRKMARIFPHDYKPKIVIHSIDDDLYPESDTTGGRGISPWFRVEFAGHYHAGIEVYLNIEHIIVDRGDGAWAEVRYGANGIDGSIDLKEAFANTRYDVVKAFTIGRIPFRNIFEVDEEGDEYYPEPHLYCRFADRGTPYELVLRREVDGYKEFHPGERFPFEDRDTRASENQDPGGAPAC